MLFIEIGPVVWQIAGGALLQRDMAKNIPDERDLKPGNITGMQMSAYLSHLETLPACQARSGAHGWRALAQLVAYQPSQGTVRPAGANYRPGEGPAGRKYRRPRIKGGGTVRRVWSEAEDSGLLVWSGVTSGVWCECDAA